jgi:hypothetical protein
VLTCRIVEPDVDEAEDDEGEAHGDGGGHANDEPPIVAFPNALKPRTRNKWTANGLGMLRQAEKTAMVSDKTPLSKIRNVSSGFHKTQHNVNQHNEKIV